MGDLGALCAASRRRTRSMRLRTLKWLLPLLAVELLRRLQRLSERQVSSELPLASALLVNFKLALPVERPIFVCH